MLSIKQLAFILLSFNLVFAVSDYAFLVPAIAVVTTIFLAIIYMFSQATSNPQLSAWVKTELRELIAGVILVIIILGLIFSARPVSQLITGDPDYMDASEAIIEDVLSGYDTAYTNLIKSAGMIRLSASFAPWISVPLWYVSLVYSEAPLSGIAPVFSAISGSVQGLSNVIFLYEGLLLLLKFCHVVIPAMLLPVSFSLRIFPLTRKVGNTLIAVSLAGFVLLPFSVILVGEMNKVIDYPDVSLSDSQLDTLYPDVAAPLMIASPFCHNEFVRFLLFTNDLIFSIVTCLWAIPFGFYNACQTLMQNVVYPIINIAFQIAYDASLLAWLSTIGAKPELYLTGSSTLGTDGVLDVLFPFLKNVTDLVLVGYLNFVLIGLITISGARSISVALGGEWYLGGIQRLV